MNEVQVIELMRSSKSETEWNNNCDEVKKACGGYPCFWFAAIIMSGLMDEVMGDGSSTMTIEVIDP